jgi:hypothetical protein
MTEHYSGTPDQSRSDPSANEGIGLPLYCKAYYLGALRKFSGWNERRINWKNLDAQGTEAPMGSEPPPFADEDIVYVHEDLTVTQSIYKDENVIFPNVTPEWETFCRTQLDFRIPDDMLPR